MRRAVLGWALLCLVGCADTPPASRAEPVAVSERAPATTPRPEAAAAPTPVAAATARLERLASALERFRAGGSDPLVSIQLLVEGMHAVAEDPDLGEQLMAMVISTDHLTRAEGTFTGHRLPRSGYLERIQAEPALALSLLGASWQRGYQDYDPGSARIEVATDYSPSMQGIDEATGRAKYFLVCGGADTPRPVTLARNASGQWKIIEWSSLTVGVRSGPRDF